MLCNILELYVDNDIKKTLKFRVKKLINAGYTGRNQEEVLKHVEELKKIGVPAPDVIPTYYLKSGEKLATENECEVIDRDSTGEAEYVLLIAKDEIFVAAGSDHTDRKLEALNHIPKAKQVTSNFISKAIWRYSDVKDHWDSLKLTAWIGSNQERLYQDTRLEALMNPEELMQRVKELTGGALEEGTVIFSGTVGALIPGAPFSDEFSVELNDEKRGQKLSCRYQIKVLAWQ